jgi:hypothetical protein
MTLLLPPPDLPPPPDASSLPSTSLSPTLIPSPVTTPLPSRRRWVPLLTLSLMDIRRRSVGVKTAGSALPLLRLWSRTAVSGRPIRRPWFLRISLILRTLVDG